VVIYGPAVLQHILPDGAGQPVRMEQQLRERLLLQGRIGLQSTVEGICMAGENLIVVGHDGGPVQIRLQGAGGIGQTGERVGEGHGQRILSEY